LQLRGGSGSPGGRKAAREALDEIVRRLKAAQAESNLVDGAKVKERVREEKKKLLQADRAKVRAEKEKLLRPTFRPPHKATVPDRA
jgi:hypothetical protein